MPLALFLAAVLVAAFIPSIAIAAGITEYKIPTAGSQPGGITKGPDGALWFTEKHAGMIGRMTMNGKFTEYHIPYNNWNPDHIAAGRDGKLWFTGEVGGGGKIGAVDMFDQFWEFAIPSGNNAYGITSGPDGNLWFTEYDGNKIGRVTTDGDVTEWSTPTGSIGIGGSHPYGITSGPDGALWFTENYGNKIGRVTTGGHFTEYDIPTAASGPTDITTGPDGALWFTETQKAQIGRITTGGSFTEYSFYNDLITSGSCDGITAGSDGALWFTIPADIYSDPGEMNKIGRMTTGGEFSQYDTPTPRSNSMNMTNGPYGTLWFTETDGNKIGRVPLGRAANTSRTWGHDSIGSSEMSTTWYLAEGSTNGGFETWILVQNPGYVTAHVHLTYMTPQGKKTGPTVNLQPGSRKSFNVADTVPNTWEVSTTVTSNEGVVAERAMYGPSRAWGHNSIGSSSSSKSWYLAEGCTNGGFETWVLVQNPRASAADVSLTYMTPQGQKAGPSLRLPPYSRKSFNVADTVPNTWEVSTTVTSKQPVIAERSVYWNNRKGGHESLGVSNPSKNWYLAEGSTAGGFETWILVQNPGGSSASVNLSYMTEKGQVAGPHLNLPPHSRQTVNVASVVPNTWSVSTRVTSKQPVIAERAVYWNNRIEGHDSIGTTAPATEWFLAEGSTGAGFETWVLVQNPNGSAATVNLLYMTPDGLIPGPSVDIAAHSRVTFNVADQVADVYEVSTDVISNIPVIAERAMYGNMK